MKSSKLVNLLKKGNFVVEEPGKGYRRVVSAPNPVSIVDKLKRKNFPFTMESILHNLNDVAGVRIICSFIDDIYDVADMFASQDDITVIEIKDYIKNPKPKTIKIIGIAIFKIVTIVETVSGTISSIVIFPQVTLSNININKPPFRLSA